MASLYRDPRSPFWFLRYKAVNGRWRSKSLRPLRHGVAGDTQKARKARDQQSLEEHSRSPQRDSWASWVPDYLRTRYTRNSDTLRRALNAWSRLAEYFAERKVFAPQDLNYRACMDYLPYRIRKAAHNTALLELKILGVVCDEAIRRGIISVNPAAKLGIGRVRGRVKPELSDSDIERIREALKNEPAWMSHAFEVALHQGCRLSETALFTTNCDFNRGVVHFAKTKGEKPFSVPMHPGIQPILKSLCDRAVSSRIFELPPQAARNFHRFFKSLGLAGGITFHSTRVTVASRLARSGYSITKAMRLLNHSSELVHRTYQRLQAEDVADAYELLRLPPVSSDNQLNEKPGDPSAI
jgi:site-specific recombinase XerD